MKKDFFRVLEEYDKAGELNTVTVLKGKAAGEKAILCDGKAVYFSDSKGFLKEHEKELLSLPGNGVCTLSELSVYTETVGGVKDLIICGCGHVSIPVIKIGKLTGFRVTAIDDRSEFTGNAGQAGADRVIAAPFEEALKQIEGSSSAYFVVVTRGHHWDEECLRLICQKPHAYIGMMGSKSRVAVVRENLVKEGIEKDIIDSVHSPIGLRIGSETPEEIAVSIIAEIIEVKNKHKEQVIAADILSEINNTQENAEDSGGKILATIVARSGSAPRAVGTKMLITPVKTVNTIGGGLLEARVTEKGREMLKGARNTPTLLHLELSADAASMEGEVCGGVIDVLFEEIE